VFSHIYDLPHWVAGIEIVGLIVGLSVGGFRLFRRWNPIELRDDDKSLALAILAVIATVNSLLLAFSAVSVWESYSAADEAVVAEANTVAELARDLAVFNSAESQSVRGMLHDYARMVVEQEWPDMRSGQQNDETWQRFNRMFIEVGTLAPDTTQRTVLLSEIWARTNELVKFRRSRLYFTQAEVPSTLWAVVLIGTTLTILTTFVLPPTRFNTTMVGALALSMGLVFFFVIAMDRPFAGQEAIDSGPFETTLFNMERWDELYGPALQRVD
jgi:hypothetical protein